MPRPLASLYRCVFSLVIAASLAACRGALGRTAQAGDPAATLTRFAPQSFPTSHLPATATPAPTPRPVLDAPIIWYLSGETPPDLPAISEAFNRMLAERGFNARVDLRPIEPANFDRRMAEILSKHEAWDVVSLTGSRYAGWVEQAALLPLESQSIHRLETGAPGLWASLPEDAWPAVRVRGVIYAVPNQGIWARARGVSIRADVVQALGLQAAVDQLRAPEDLTALLARIYAAWKDGELAEKGVADAQKITHLMGQADLLSPDTAGFDLLADPFAVRYDDAGLQVVNWCQAPEFKALAGLRRAWQQAGYLPDVALDPEAALDGYRSGRSILAVGSQVYPGSAQDRAAQLGYAWVDQPLAPVFLNTQAVTASVTGINARLSTDAERARRVTLLLEWLHTDAGLYNLLAYGIEGQHWRWTGAQRAIIQLAPGAAYLPDFAGQIGDQTLAYAVSGDQPGRWLAVRQANASAPASAALGFRFDPKPVGGELFAVQGRLPELLDPLANGRYRDVEKAVAGMGQNLADAGSETVREELARQLAQWQALR